MARTLSRTRDAGEGHVYVPLHIDRVEGNRMSAIAYAPHPLPLSLTSLVCTGTGREPFLHSPTPHIGSAYESRVVEHTPAPDLTKEVSQTSPVSKHTYQRPSSPTKLALEQYPHRLTALVPSIPSCPVSEVQLMPTQETSKLFPSTLGHSISAIPATAHLKDPQTAPLCTQVSTREIPSPFPGSPDNGTSWPTPTGLQPANKNHQTHVVYPGDVPTQGHNLMTGK